MVVSLQIGNTSYGCWVIVESIVKLLVECIEEWKRGGAESIQNDALATPLIAECTVSEGDNGLLPVDKCAALKQSRVLNCQQIRTGRNDGPFD